LTFHVSEFMKTRNLPPSSSDLILVNFLLWKAFHNIVLSRLPWRWSPAEACSVVTLLGLLSRDANKKLRYREQHCASVVLSLWMLLVYHRPLAIFHENIT